MVATLTEAEECVATQRSAIDRLESLVPAAVHLSELRHHGELSQPEFERGLSNLFRTARDAQSSLGTEYTRVHVDWSEEPVKVGLDGSSAQYEALYARTDSLLQPYFGYGWEYRDGGPQQAVRFDERQAVGPEGETYLHVFVSGAWVHLVR